MVTLYHQIKTSNSFWCRRRLNPRTLIQPLETLPVELTGTHVNLDLRVGDIYIYIFGIEFKLECYL